MTSYRFLSREDAFVALIKAPLAPAAVVFLLDAVDRAATLGPLAIFGAAILAFYILIVMEVASLVVGGLAIELLWKRVSFNVLLTSALGGLIAILPLLALLLPGPVDGLNAWSGGKPTVIDGQKTPYGYRQDFETMIVVFAFGMFGGASFWWFGRPKGKISNDVPDDR